MQNSVRKKKVLKKWVRVLFLFVIFIVGFASITMMVNGYKNMKNKEVTVKYAYNIKQNVDYQVNLYDNSFIDSPTLGEGKMYISDLVKNIKTTYFYSYSGNEIIPLKYDYSILATINGKYQLNGENEENKVWVKEFVLKEPETVEINDTNVFNINEDVEIDYNYFNSVVSDFRKEFKLSITAILNVKMKVNVVGLIDNKEVKETKELYVEIPLNQQAFEIKKHYENKHSNAIYEDNNNVERGKKNLISGFLVLLIDLFLFFNLYTVIFNIKKKNNYTIALNKILKEYGEIIVEVVNPVLDETLNIIEVKNFNEMVDLEEELRIPIMFYETEKYYRGEFVIVYNNILYKYVLTDDVKK